MSRLRQAEVLVQEGDSTGRATIGAPEFMTRAEAAGFLGLSADLLDRLVRSNRVPFVDLSDLGQRRPGARAKRLVRFSRGSLTAWMLGRERPVLAEPCADPRPSPDAVPHDRALTPPKLPPAGGRTGRERPT